MEVAQTRLEHSRSLEDAEKYRALQTLTELGALVPLTEIDTYHGRVGETEGEAWSVDPSFQNGGNDSGNFNIHERAALYTADEATSRDFAQARAREIIRPKVLGDLEHQLSLQDPIAWREAQLQKRRENYDAMSDEQRKFYKVPPTEVEDRGDWQPHELRKAAWELSYHGAPEAEDSWNRERKNFQIEIHDIASSDPEARVLDFGFDWTKLPDEDKERYRTALKALLLPITEGSPVDFGQAEQAPVFASALGAVEGYVTTEQAEQVAEQAGVDREVALQLAGGLNAQIIARQNLGYLCQAAYEIKA